MKVSVIIPAYNRAHCIMRAIRSVQEQTFTDLEIIVVDDASTDNTAEIVKAIPDERIRYIYCQNNGGAGAARNEGLKVAQGEYIAFLDSDDQWLPEKLARQVERMESEPEEIGVCFCGGTIIKNEDAAHPVAYTPDKRWERDTFRQFVTEQIPFLTPTVLLRRKCLEKSGLMVPEMRRNEDREFLLRVFAHYGLAVVPEPHIVCNLVVAAQTNQYDALKVAAPYRLRHRNLVRERLGLMTSIYYTCLLRTNLLRTAIRERRWREASREFWLRLRTCPLLFPKEISMILKALFAEQYLAYRKAVT